MDIESAKLLGAGIAVLGVIGSGIGIGSIFSAFITAVGRNPEAREHVFTMTMLGFALVEALALFALIIALLLLFVFLLLCLRFFDGADLIATTFTFAFRDSFNASKDVIFVAVGFIKKFTHRSTS